MAKRLVFTVAEECNSNCLFCFNKDTVSQHKLKTIMKVIQENGKNQKYEELILSGGEPTLNKKLINIIKLAKMNNFSLIQVQSNGRRFSDKSFAKKFVSAGANQFYISIHAPKKSIHDKLLQSNGAFYQTINGIKNLKDLNVSLLTNTVINKHNYKYLPEMVLLLNKLKVDLMQLVFLQPLGNALKYKNIIPTYSEVMPYLHSALKQKIKSRIIVQGIPYCFMNGFESYINEHNEPVDMYGMDLNGNSEFKDARRNMAKTKSELCKHCKYDDICEGAWNGYADMYGTKELKPIFKEKNAIKTTP